MTHSHLVSGIMIQVLTSDTRNTQYFDKSRPRLPIVHLTTQQALEVENAILCCNSVSCIYFKKNECPPSSLILMFSLALFKPTFFKPSFKLNN